MGPWGPLPEDELKILRRRDRIRDDNIAIMYARYIAVRDTVWPSQSLEQWIPKSYHDWIRTWLNSAESLKAMAEARIAHQWAVYDRSSSKRPLYPRPRAVSSASQDFDPDKQSYNSSQDQSLLFSRLPPELRAEIYRAVFGGQLIVDIVAQHGGFRGPPPSEQHRVFGSSRIHLSTGEVYINGFHYSARPDAKKWRPSIVPLLQSCRKMYDEAMPILYGEMLFTSKNSNNSVDWAKFLLQSRLQMIRTMHFKLTMGYPWEAPCFRDALELLVTMKGLQKLCILGNSGGMIDCNSSRSIIDESLWQEKKSIFMTPFRKLDFIKEVDIFLPIPKEILVKHHEDKLGHIRIHGLTDDELAGKTVVYCACKYRADKLAITHKDQYD